MFAWISSTTTTAITRATIPVFSCSLDALCHFAASTGQSLYYNRHLLPLQVSLGVRQTIS